MTITIWTILLMIPALLAGGLAGWFASRRLATDLPSADAPLQATKGIKQQAVQNAEVELTTLESQLSDIDQQIIAARKQIQQRDDEYASLLIELDQQRNLLDDTRSDLTGIEQDLSIPSPYPPQQDSDAVLAGIQSNLEELELLAQVEEGNRVKINRLSQQVQWQESELRMLRQAVKAKTAEIDEAKALLEHREAELRRIIRQRQQREADVERARDMLELHNEQLRHHLHQIQNEMNVDVEGEEEGVEIISSSTVNRPPQPLLGDGVPSLSIIEPDDNHNTNETGDSLTALPGLDQAIIRKLRELGINTCAQLARWQPRDLQRLLDLPASMLPVIAEWVKTARDLSSNSFPDQE